MKNYVVNNNSLGVKREIAEDLALMLNCFASEKPILKFKRNANSFQKVIGLPIKFIANNNKIITGVVTVGLYIVGIITFIGLFS